MAPGLRDLWRDEDGVETVEYALLLAIFIAAGVACLNGLSCKTISTVYQASRAFDSASGHGHHNRW